MIQTRVGQAWALGALAQFVAAGCFYSFENPVEKAPPGSIAGRVALQEAVGGETPAGGEVTVMWTNGLRLKLGSAGTFLFLDLPDGTYSLDVTIPPLVANDTPLIALEPNALIRNVGDSQIDSLDIGTLSIPASGTLGGTVSPPAAGIIVAVFAPGLVHNGDASLGVFEGFATLTDAAGHYRLQLPPGDHVVAASDASDSVIAATSIRAGVTQSLDLSLQPVVQPGEITGALVGSGFGVSASGSVPWNGATYVVTDDGGATLSSGPLFPTPDVSPGTGSLFELSVPAGQLVSVTLLSPPSASPDPCLEIPPFALPPLPLIAGQTTNLGQVTWLDNAALAANGIGACADGGSAGNGATGGTTSGATGATTTGGGSTGSATGGSSAGSTGGTSGGTSGGQSGGTTGGGPGNAGTIWVDAGFILWDGGTINQTQAFPFTADGGRLIAWIAGSSGTANLYYATDQDGFVPVALTDGGQVSPGTLSGVQLGDGVLLTYAVSSATEDVSCEFISSATGPAGVVNPAFPVHPFLGLAAAQTTTFAGVLGQTPGAFVLIPEFFDAGIVGAFTADGTSFGPAFGLGPSTPDRIVVYSLIGVSCDLADLQGGPGFCVAGAGEVDELDAGLGIFGFISAVSTSGTVPSLTSTQILANGSKPLVLVGLAALPGQVAVIEGPYTQTVDYWQLSSLADPPDAGIPVTARTDVLVNWDDSILGLAVTGAGTSSELLPYTTGLKEPPTLAGVMNGQGSNFPAAFYEAATDSVVVAGVPATDTGAITIWQLLPVSRVLDGG